MNLSDPVACYVRDAQPVYRALQHGLVQLAAFALARATTGAPRFIDLGPVEVASDALKEGHEALAALRVPAEARHHRQHLGAAAEALGHALGAAFSRRETDSDVLFLALEEAERHLKALAKLLPGFEPVDFSQACCAAHSRLTIRAPAGAAKKTKGEDHGRLFDLGA